MAEHLIVQCNALVHFSVYLNFTRLLFLNLKPKFDPWLKITNHQDFQIIGCWILRLFTVYILGERQVDRHFYIYLTIVHYLYCCYS